jgi:hypothetical protein
MRYGTISTRQRQNDVGGLAKRYGINQKTVAKWKKRETVADLPTGPKDAKSTVLSIEDKAIIVDFRRHTLLPLDDCFATEDATSDALVAASLPAASRHQLVVFVFFRKACFSFSRRRGANAASTRRASFRAASLHLAQ